MRIFIFVIVFCLAPYYVFSQTGSITGKIIRADTKNPVAKASVFLSNATYGTTTTDDGTFTLKNVKPGRYELVITSLGYEDFTQQVVVDRAAITVNAELIPRMVQLRDVVITTPANWKRNYELFVKDFLGTSRYARQCKILNPHDLTFIYSKSKKTLTASSYDFINIENRALGYRIKFLLNEFTSDGFAHIIAWQGRILYQELEGSASQKKIWEERRKDIYYGSAMHFYRSLISGHFTDDGFVMLQLLRKPNPQRPSEVLIQKKLDKFQECHCDSLKYWNDKFNLSRYDDSLIRKPFLPEQLVARTERQGIFALTFPNYLYVIYTKKRENETPKDIYRPLDMDNFATSVITRYQPYVFFDMNGTVVSNQSALYEGAWAKDKIAELLPVDYNP